MAGTTAPSHSNGIHAALKRAARLRRAGQPIDDDLIRISLVV
jgi:hypothetical protein